MNDHRPLDVDAQLKTKPKYGLVGVFL